MQDRSSHDKKISGQGAALSDDQRQFVQFTSATERLIYSLSPSMVFEADTRQQFCLLNEKQIACLMAVVDYWLLCADLGEQYPVELDCAKAFLQRLRGDSLAQRMRQNSMH